MPDIFRSHLNRFVSIEDTELERIVSFFKTKEVKNKEHLLSEGQLCRYNYFVLDGCLRKFLVNKKGVEQTIDFALEGWWMTDNMAFEQGMKTELNIQAVAHAAVLQIGNASLEQLLREHPVMERYFRIIYHRAYAAAQHRIRLLYEYSREELYRQFASQFPEFVKRVPQYLLASFLGFTPEYLSEIRKKMRS